MNTDKILLSNSKETQLVVIKFTKIKLDLIDYFIKFFLFSINYCIQQKLEL